ncbi:MAG TPA: dipeptidase [Terriglobales bacterium]|nr:dipeptidase [Terriglobales bacterium]
MTAQPVADLHLDTVLEIQAGADLGAGNAEGHVDLDRMRAGGAGLLAFAAYVPSVLPVGRAFPEAIALLDHVDRTCARFPTHLAKIGGAADAEAAVAAGKTGILPAVENGHAIESDLGKLEALRRRGARYLTLTHARHLPWAASSGEEGAGPGGLTAFGREVVRAMESLGMIVDVSHVHETTFWDVTRVARKPFIASHSCCSALCPLPRNLTDDQIRAIAASGGMVGISFSPGFLDPRYFPRVGASLTEMFRELEAVERTFADDPARKQAEWHRMGRTVRERLGPAEANASSIAAHVRHVVDLVGDDSVGFGSDFDGFLDLPRDVPGCDAYPRILDALRAAGLGEESVRKIAWGNFVRVLKATGE